MGLLDDRVKLSLLVNGNGLPDNYKNNALYLMEKITKSDDEYEAINISDIKVGSFCFIRYQDPSNWMMWSPVFIIDSKKFDNKVVIFAVNLNFIPLEIRTVIFDPYFIEKNFDINLPLKVNYKGMYDELLKWGFEYSLVEYNAIQIRMVHQIEMNSVPRFLMSGHPLTRYDPQKLIQIWTKKLETRDQRHNEMMNSLVSDFYEMDGKIKEQYQVLKGHVQRIQNSLRRF